jgi:hypothetical protein
MATRLLESLMRDLDVSEILPKVTTPTIVIHRKGDRACSVQGGRELAAAIPNARLVLLDGIDHVPCFGDSDEVSNAILDFLGDKGASASTSQLDKSKITKSGNNTDDVFHCGDNKVRKSLISISLWCQ